MAFGLGLGLGLTRQAARQGGGGVTPGPVNTVAPVVSGTAAEGETLSTTDGTWVAFGTVVYTYQWLRDGGAISGATAATYELVGADIGADISCEVTATDEFGSGAQVSNEVGPVAFVGPFDGITTRLAYSMRRLYADYIGDSFRIRRDSDDAEMDAPFLANGDLDVATVTAWLGGSAGFVTTRYDQSGNADNEIQAIDARQPAFEEIDGLPGLHFSAANDNNMAAAIAQVQPMVCSSIVRTNNIISLSLIWGSEGNAINAGINAGAGHYLAAGAALQSGAVFVANTLYQITHVLNGASSKVRRNGTTDASGNAGSNNINTTFVTSPNGPFDWNGFIMETILYAATDENTTIENNQKEWAGIP